MSESMIEASVARLFSTQVDKRLLESVEAGQFAQSLWDLAASNGFGLALASEDAGGSGQGWSEAWPILRGLGYWQVPLPLAETMIAAQLLSMAGIEVPEAPITLLEQGLDNDLSAHGAASALRLEGRATRVPWARDCAWALVSLAEGGIALVDLRDRGSVTIRPHANLARTPSDEIAFDATPVVAQAANPLATLARPVWTLAAVARSAMMVGALEFLLEQSVQYASDRVQFGKPIGRNQAIQQQLALLAGDVAAARMAALVAAGHTPSADARSDNPATEFSAAVAKIRCGEAATRGNSIAHQVHGAIGFTYEHMLNFATRRLWTWREEFGSDAWWAERLGRAAIAGGSATFWSGLTQRRFATPVLEG